MRRILVLFTGCVLACVMLMASGCGSDQKEVNDQGTADMSVIAEAYFKHIEEKKKPPQKPGDITPYLPKEKTVDQWLKSPDGSEYVIIWGTNPFQGGLGSLESPLVIGYQKVSSEGKRAVFSANGSMIMSDEEFAKATFPNGHQPPK